MSITQLTPVHLSNPHLFSFLIVSTLNSPQNIRFHDSQFLVLINRILAFFFAIAGLIVINYRGTTKKPIHSDKSYSIAPLYQFLFCSLSNILSSWCQYEALKFVNFPTQVCIREIFRLQLITINLLL